MSLGTYPEISLREARGLRDEARALLAKNVNPRIERKKKRAAIRFAGENTFKIVYEKWFQHRERSLKEGRQTSRSLIPRIFKKDVLPKLLLLTGVRTGELRLATPDQFHLDQGLWIIPSEVVKQLQMDMRKKRQRPQDIPPYIVPLSVQAMEIVRYMLDQCGSAQRYLFRHDYDPKKTLSENM